MNFAVADTHRGDGKIPLCPADEKTTAFLELELVTRARGELPRQASEIFPNSPDMKTRIPSVLITFALVCFGLVQNTQAVVPVPDGGYPGGNTAEGQDALLSLTSGLYNTAAGLFSLRALTGGSFNTAIGAGTLLLNTANENTAIGAGALLSNTTGASNTATGESALFSNTTGARNTAIGWQALVNNTTGASNTAIGWQALFNNTTGARNTAIGIEALESNTTGSDNIALGRRAGFNVSAGDNVICIGANVLGNNIPNSCFIGNIRGVTTGIANAIPVVIDSAGQLGTMSSSRRFKKEIKPMDKASEAILTLKPVTFHYKSDNAGTPQFGLIAEEVAAVNPDLVVRDNNGEIYTVRYDAVNAMLLNEFLKEHRKNEEQEATIARQQKQIDALTTGLQKVSAQLEAGKPAPQVVNNP
jgi:hypothetical protein